MLVYMIRRVSQSLLVVAVMASLVFLAVFAVGDPIDILANPNADQAERAAIAQSLGLDRPLYEQFGLFAVNALQGDLGRSFVYNLPAIDVILVDRPDQPLMGAGEAATAPVAAALGNAVFDATGVRLRTVPFTAARVKAALAGGTSAT